jgi:hypothetical protein
MVFLNRRGRVLRLATMTDHILGVISFFHLNVTGAGIRFLVFRTGEVLGIMTLAGRVLV